jgi:Concanavalin A-like lectin/glucanases superfamily/Neutral/alkaline non-lysosomal ceramidase, N-terminal
MMRGCVVCILFLLSGFGADARAELSVGAAIVDVSPDQLPVIVNGGMLSNTANQIKTPINARAIVLSDAQERIAIVVVDSCMMPKELLDEAKQLASTRTQLKPDRILISATHTHSAPSSMGALGTEADTTYVPLLRQRLVEAIVAAAQNLQPAEVGWSKALAPEFTALRRWVRRPDRVALDPFGNPTVRANMHSARNPDDAIGPTGPEDPELTMIGFRTLDTKLPIALLANFSMHYFSDSPISSDYFGLFSDGMQQVMQQRHPQAKQVVAAMSHGCSGDIWRRDYFKLTQEKDWTINTYTQGLLAIASQAYDKMEYFPDTDLAMAEARLPMKYRVPDAQRLEWAQRIVEEMGDRLPKSDREVYAREQIILHERQATEIVVQAIRIGKIAIASTPNETYALTGLKLKLQSPLERTMVIELANGGDGYIPPPEQHYLGGYNTWAARSAGLETTAEPRIVATNLNLLEQVCAAPRRSFQQSEGANCRAIMAAKPLAYWRMHEFAPPLAVDHSGHFRHATYEPGVLFFLEGDGIRAFTSDAIVNRCSHFAGGRLRTELPGLGSEFSLSISFWNGMPDQAREIAGWMFSRDEDLAETGSGLHLGLDGKGDGAGCMTLQIGQNERVTGKTVIERWTWHQATLIRTPDSVRIYLDGSPEPEIVAQAKSPERNLANIFVGGASHNRDNWEGRLDEVAIFDRALTASDIKSITNK